MNLNFECYNSCFTIILYIRMQAPTNYLQKTTTTRKTNLKPKFASSIETTLPRTSKPTPKPTSLRIVSKKYLDTILDTLKHTLGMDLTRVYLSRPLWQCWQIFCGSLIYLIGIPFTPTSNTSSRVYPIILLPHTIHNLFPHITILD